MYNNNNYGSYNYSIGKKSMDLLLWNRNNSLPLIFITARNKMPQCLITGRAIAISIKLIPSHTFFPVCSFQQKGM